jgi:hypothetical protein
MQLMGAVVAYPRNSEIFGDNESADYLYKVVSGSVRTYKILSDGRRQVGGFYLPGDIFGLEFSDEHTLSAEAITDAKVLVVKRSAITALAGRDASVARQLFTLTGWHSAHCTRTTCWPSRGLPISCPSAMLSVAADMARMKPILDMITFILWLLAPLIYRKAGLMQCGTNYNYGSNRNAITHAGLPALPGHYAAGSAH